MEFEMRGKTDEERYYNDVSGQHYFGEENDKVNPETAQEEEVKDDMSRSQVNRDAFTREFII